MADVQKYFEGIRIGQLGGIVGLPSFLGFGDQVPRYP